MLENIDVGRMNRLMKENREAKKIISQLLENHRTEVSMIAHEIRNPLTLVSSSLQIMEAQHPEVKDFHNWAQTVEDVEFMCSLLNDLSSFNNSRTLHYSVFSIEKLLKNIAVSFAISLEADGSETQFTAQIIPGMCEFTGDKIKLEQLILNLLQNAKDATAGTGSIFLRASGDQNGVTITCRDTGCGIDADKLDTIFDPFVTYKENGTGLGLSTARQIAEAHGGSLSVQSVPGKETVFTIVLPA